MAVEESQLIVIPPQAARLQAPVGEGPNSVSVEQLNVLWQLAKHWTNSGLLPAHIKSPAQALTIAMMGDALGVRWLTAVQHMYVVHGRVGCEGKLLLGLVQRSGLLEDFNLDISPQRAICMMKRKGYSKPNIITFTIEKAQKMKLTEFYDREAKQWKPQHTWTSQPDVMLGWKAVSANARFTFADVVMGMYTFDELGLPTKASPAGDDAELDTEEVKNVVDQPLPPAEEIKAEEPRVEMPTQEQIVLAAALTNEKYSTGAYVLSPKQRKDFAAKLAVKQDRAYWQTAIEAVAALVAKRLDEANDATEPSPAPAATPTIPEERTPAEPPLPWEDK